ncbi:C40 family peptidase [Aurantibacter crassamenti]|uniref:C40 family peptidase n=1 Tax=Aurantibacter crassamenti TaxID=1837375 RepID=UPI0019395696|nr:NlpC/P60 family protein [Aurantibacter crassamenti]MBM1107806.1 C40 family peptidase [Aurantibacter crassamenti]
MQYGICHLSIIPIRLTADEVSEMITQMLYGEHYKILEQRKHWSKVRLAFDGSEGWIQNNQITNIEKESYTDLDTDKHPNHAAQLVSYMEGKNSQFIPILLGSTIPKINILEHTLEGEVIKTEKKLGKENLVNTALYYLNSPSLSGGRSPFGIDSAGFSQMVYKMNGVVLKRTADQQALQGDSLSFIEESEPGDLAFFDDSDGKINHVGIIMRDNYVVHVNGKVKVDRIDHTGIFDNELRKYTHKLRVIKQIVR